MRRHLLLCLVLLGCGGGGEPVADNTGPGSDSAVPDAGLHCDSWYEWCEDGVRYRAYPEASDSCFPSSPELTCQTSDDWDFLQKLSACAHGCAPDAGCRWCESTDECPTVGAGLCLHACPNAIASDESCSMQPGDCVKDWGSGASYCAGSCAQDGDCPSALVCHPTDGYCTTPCSSDLECDLVPDRGCDLDHGVCDYCRDCY